MIPDASMRSVDVFGKAFPSAATTETVGVALPAAERVADAEDPLGPPDVRERRRAWKVAETLIRGRQNVSAKRLEAPGPDPVQLHRMLRAAAAAPDHGRLVPWRFIVVPAEERVLLADAFADAFLDRDPTAGPAAVLLAREKAFRAPLLMLAVASLGPAQPHIPPLERVISLGCAIQNILLAAHAMRFACGLTSGKAMASSALRKLFLLGQDEEAVCFVNLGTARRQRPVRPRPATSQFLSSL